MRKALLLALALSISTTAYGVNIKVINADTGTSGLNDPTPVDPVGGNTGTTLGQQRLNVYLRAADIWSKVLQGNIDVVVSASFADLECTSTSAVLGSAGPATFFSDFDGAPQSGVWYPIALANQFANRDLNSASSPEITARFNGKLGKPGCTNFGSFYLGFDGNHGNDIDFLSTALHEFAHGLGFSGTVDVSTGQLGRPTGNGAGLPAVFEQHIFDTNLGLRWDQMTNGQRKASATNDQGLMWDGPAARTAAAKVLQGTPILRINSPSAAAGSTLEVGTAVFGSRLNVPGVSGTVVTATDSADDGSTTNACTDITNPGAIIGRIALVDRGSCAFVQKALNVQNAGAIGMIVIDNDATVAEHTGMGGSDIRIKIPAVRLTTTAGATLKAALATGLNVSLTTDPARPAGLSSVGMIKLYAPTTLRVGSSVFHWDISAYPSILMQHEINGDLPPGNIDITPQQMFDIGWTLVPTEPVTDPSPSGRRGLKRGK